MDEFPPLGNTQRKKKLSELVPYTKGKRIPVSFYRLAAPKPEWLDDKVLVVSRLDKYYMNHKKELHEKFTDMASNAAGHPVHIKHMEILSRTHSPWLTVAIELKYDDFDAVFNETSWEAGLCIRHFLGKRFWRGRPRLTKEQARSAVRMSWSS